MCSPGKAFIKKALVFSMFIVSYFLTITCAPQTFKKKEVAFLFALPEKVDKPKLTFVTGDLIGNFSGSMRMDYIFYKDVDYLNKNMPDEFGFFKQTIDFMFDLAYGQNKFDHKAFEAYFDLRSKSKWGVVGAYRNTSFTEVKLGDISLGEHTHNSSRVIPWFKDAWMQFSFNAAFGFKSKKIHYFKLGWFPWWVGRGIALGPFYATVYERLGLFSYITDASAPGISIYGELIKDKLSYDLYYSKFEDQSTCCSDLVNTERRNHVGRYYQPYRGKAKDDELWAAKLKWEPIDGKKSGKLDLEPYIYFNEASAQKIDVPGDSKAQIGAYGISAEYKKGKFEMGGEVAFNYGKQYAYAIDRNVIQMKYLTDSAIPKNQKELFDTTKDSYGTGMPFKAYNYVELGDGQTPAPINSFITTAAINNQTRAAGSPYPNADNNENYLQNKADRIRPAYIIKLRGWMGVIDAAYHIEKIDLSIGTEFAHASGDADPHVKGDERDKTYRGFIGLHELYNGKRITSALIAGERSIKKPANLLKGEKEADGFRAHSNPTFSDLNYIGFNLTWAPSAFKHKKLELSPNLIFFWKASTSYRYDFDAADPDLSQVSDDVKAGTYLGTEINLFVQYELLKDLSLWGVVAAFIPGSYYKDIKGVPIATDYWRDTLGAPPETDPLKFRISDDTGFFMKISLVYKF